MRRRDRSNAEWECAEETADAADGKEPYERRVGFGGWTRSLCREHGSALHRECDEECYAEPNGGGNIECVLSSCHERQSKLWLQKRRSRDFPEPLHPCEQQNDANANGQSQLFLPHIEQEYEENADEREVRQRVGEHAAHRECPRRRKENACRLRRLRQYPECE